MKRTLSLVATAILAAALCSCGGSDNNTPATTSTTTATEVSSETPTTSTAPAFVEVGQPATHGGITLTVTKASSPDTYPVMEGSYKKNSGYDTYADTPPRTGGKLIRIDATVENNTAGSIDLTCSLPVVAYVSDGSRMFDPVDDLYKIQGTPDCNEDLNPGFSSDMTWIFEVPVDTPIKMFIFRDYDGPQDGGEIVGIIPFL
ncbi:lipoprotein [Gordonia phage Pytheas]|nr:lipoprotein [Gordonia Phage Jablanski]UYL88045.1 lipoprotein [Gordonia phage Pytheas]